MRAVQRGVAPLAVAALLLSYRVYEVSVQGLLVDGCKNVFTS